MGRITSGISQIGGKFRLVNKLLDFTPYHEFFLSMFLGAAHFELNKPRCRYECWNDANSEIVNYLLQIREHPKEFDEMKQGVFGLVSQEICNRIVNGKIKPKNDLEKAYFFYYLNKLTFGGSVAKGYTGLNQNRAIPQSTFHEADIEKIKEDFEKHHTGYGIIKNNVLPNISVEIAEKSKAKFRGVSPMGFQQKVEGAKSNFRGITPKVSFKEIKAPYAGIHNTRVLGPSINKRDIDKWKKEFQSSYKGINPKTTRPFKNNDCGLLSPISPEAIKRLRYVNLTTYDFRKVYKMFYEAFYVRKGLERECFIYADEPFPGTEKYYGDLFPKELHEDLLNILLETPFNFMFSTGGDCLELYIEPLKDAGWVIIPVKVKYSTDANSQKDSQEFICTNYNIEKIALMTQDSKQKVLEKYF